MKKIWISLFLLASVIGGGFWYNSYLGRKTDDMLSLEDNAYQAIRVDMEKCEGLLDEIDEKLDSVSVLLCAFIDRDIINQVEDAIISAKGLAKMGGDACRWGIEIMKEEIGHIKNTTQIKLKYIL